MRLVGRLLRPRLHPRRHRRQRMGSSGETDTEPRLRMTDSPGSPGSQSHGWLGAQRAARGSAHTVMDTRGDHERTPAVMYLAAVALLVAALVFSALPRLVGHADTAAEQLGG